MRALIGIDDTDDIGDRGTGFRARRLGALLEQENLAELLGVTRHQLLQSPEIPSTSQNSSACLAVHACVHTERLIQRCADFLLAESAPAADAGLCVADWERVGEPVQALGRRAKQEVLDFTAPLELARQEGIYLEGLTGTGGGLVGALAAVGLRASGNDGRFIWLVGTRNVSGVHSVESLCRTTGIQSVRALDGTSLPPAVLVDVGPWVRPILSNGEAVLLVERAVDQAGCQWRAATRELVKERTG
jgi:hypothetical protein